MAEGALITRAVGGRGGGPHRPVRSRRAARGREGLGGRSLVVMVLVGFLIVAIGVITRRTYGLRETRAIAHLSARRDSLAIARSQLEGEVRDASSRSRLLPIVEQRLNMRVPRPEQQITLPRSLVPSVPPADRR